MSVSATPDPVPMVTSPLDTLIVSSGVYFEFIIPENTFIDLQDGNTRNLTLSLLDVNGQVGESEITFGFCGFRSIVLCIIFSGFLMRFLNQVFEITLRIHPDM